MIKFLDILLFCDIKNMLLSDDKVEKDLRRAIGLGSGLGITTIGV
jgi:hypothetical protein